jgi:hypothetical protein
MLVDGAALGRHIAPQSGQRLLQPSPAIDNQELRLAQLALDEVVEDGPPSLVSPPIFLTATSTFWPS